MSECYCEDRVCTCTPEVVEAVERLIDPPEPDDFVQAPADGWKADL